MKSGLDGRNNLRTATFLARQDDVSMKSGLDGRNNEDAGFIIDTNETSQ